MSLVISLVREKQRKAIRRAQLSGFFSARRQLMLTMPKADASEALLSHLRELRQFVLAEQSWPKLLHSLLKLHRIMSDYDTVDILLGKAGFQESMLLAMKLGEDYREMTWIDVVLYLLRQFQGEMPIVEESSWILGICALGVGQRIRKKAGLGDQFLLKQLRRMTEGYNYQLLETNHIQLVINSLIFVYNALIGCPDSTCTYFLVNRVSPNVVVMLTSLLAKQQMLEIASVRLQICYTAFTLIFFVQRYNLVSFQKQAFSDLKLGLKRLLLEQLGNFKDQEAQFSRYCEYMEILSQIGQVGWERVDLENIQKYMERSFMKGNAKYMKLLKAILDRTIWTLSSKSMFLLFQSLFDLSEPKQLSFKCLLVQIVFQQKINSGEHLSQSDAAAFVGCWGHYSRADRLRQLLQKFDDYEFGQQALRKLLQMMIEMLEGEKRELIQDLLEDELAGLLRWPLFREVLEANNYSLVD